MTAERIVLPGESDEINDTITRLLDQLNQKSGKNRRQDDYYDGKRAVRFVGSVIPPQYLALALTLGWTGKAVDLLARRCNLDAFTWADGDLRSLAYREVWDGNRLGSEINAALVSSLIHGPAFVVTTKGGDSEPPALIHFKDATDATGDWNARRRGLDNLLSITGRSAERRVTSLVLYLDGVTIEAERDSSGWSVSRSEHSWGVPADILPYRPRIKRPFGTSRITRPARKIQDMAVRELVRTEGHMDVYSYPEFWMLGADENIFRNSDGTVKAPWQVMLGRIKGIPDDDEADGPLARADVKQFPAASPEPHLKAINMFAKLFAREVQLPDSAVAISDTANPTGADAYDSSQYELIAEAEGATDDWAPGLRNAWMRALAMAEGLSEIPSEWASMEAKWRSPRFLSRAAEADAGGKQLAAIPWLAETEVGLELLGLDEQQIQRALSEHRRASANARMDALISVGAPGADAAAVKAQADALGVLIRAGVDPADAAQRVGLDGARFTGAVPVSLRLPQVDATSLEGP